MKKLLVLLFIIVSPLMGLETEKQDNKKDLYIETGIFTRIEGMNNIEASISGGITSVSLTALEFSVGKEKIYFYSQVRFSIGISYGEYMFSGIVYDQRLGFLVGIGGRVYDSNPTSDSKKFTMHMNFGVGGDFALNNSMKYYTHTYITQPYYTIELNWMTKYYVNKNFGIQWGLDLAISGTDLTISYYEANIRYGFSFGFVF